MGNVYSLRVITGPREISEDSLEIRTLFVAGIGKSCDDTQDFPVPPGTSLLGKSPDCSICLKHPTVSRRHAELRNEGELLSITDLDSLNGTIVNGEPISPGAAKPLQPGDTVVIGKYELKVVVTQE